ncbi:MAG TPA: cupin domain-containing protein [Opitutaceae bacterium]|nr:cupin domain-containing protein [Opitutaceae bacterium]
MNSGALKVIAKLGLMPLPREGGFYRLTWVSAERLVSGRAAGSAIFFLITRDEFSGLHRMKAEELWHFHAGDAVDHVQIDPGDQSLSRSRLGGNVLAGEVPQLIVPGGIWQGARLADKAEHGWALLGCTLSPAWDEAEFELAQRKVLLGEFPAHADLVREFTR